VIRALLPRRCTPELCSFTPLGLCVCAFVRLCVCAFVRLCVCVVSSTKIVPLNIFERIFLYSNPCRCLSCTHRSARFCMHEGWSRSKCSACFLTRLRAVDSLAQRQARVTHFTDKNFRKRLHSGTTPVRHGPIRWCRPETGQCHPDFLASAGSHHGAGRLWRNRRPPSTFRRGRELRDGEWTIWTHFGSLADSFGLEPSCMLKKFASKGLAHASSI
jgi:hypothetical protein